MISEGPSCGHGRSCFSGETERSGVDPDERADIVFRGHNSAHVTNGLERAQSVGLSN